MFKKSSVIILLIICLRLFENFIIINCYTTIPNLSVAKMRSDPNYIGVMTVYKRTQTKIPQEQLRRITTLGLINGALEAEKNLEKYLTDKVADLVLNATLKEKEKKLKIDELEELIERDRNAIKVLGTVLDFASQTISPAHFQNQLKKIMREHLKNKKKIKRKQSDYEDIDDKMSKLKTEILDHIRTMKETIETKTNKTILYLETLKYLHKVMGPKKKILYNLTYNDEMNNGPLQSVGKENLSENSIDSLKKLESTAITFDEFRTQFTQNRRKRTESMAKIKNNFNTTAGPIEELNFNNSTNKTLNSGKQVQQDEDGINPGDDNDDDGFSNESGGSGGGGGGGLPSLLAGLSGGEGGSDIGALLGAISGLVAQLFGPGGLDVPSLINSGTSLIAGLLGGGRNFGTVLGEYVGLAFDGFSGGGGADPEDEDGPPRPTLFLTSFLRNLINRKNRMADDSKENDSSVEKRQAGKQGKGNGNKNDEKNHGKGSDLFGFVKHIVSAVSGGITSFILNASLGSSGGSSRGSHALISSSSTHKTN